MSINDLLFKNCDCGIKITSIRIYIISLGQGQYNFIVYDCNRTLIIVFLRDK